MKERLRQKFLKEIRNGQQFACSAADLLKVYVPYQVLVCRKHDGLPFQWEMTYEEAIQAGAENIHVKDGQLVASWPSYYPPHRDLLP